MGNINIEEVIDQLGWQFAKTMPQMPHWYTVRQRKDPEKNELYNILYRYIVENHYIEYFFRKPYKYCDIGEYKYWIMADRIEGSNIINRARIDKNGNDLQGKQRISGSVAENPDDI